jgi:hypothetical protein
VAAAQSKQASFAGDRGALEMIESAVSVSTPRTVRVSTPRKHHRRATGGHHRSSVTTPEVRFVPNPDRLNGLGTKGMQDSAFRTNQ